MSKILVIAEHDHAGLRPATFTTVTAAGAIGGDVDLLVAGDADAVKASAEAASKLEGVAKVVTVEDPALKEELAENLAPVIAEMASDYTHILAPSSTFGKDVMPRVAAKLDVAQISDIVEVVSEDTFVRPIYAGNALATVQSGDAIKVITVRASAFDKAGEGGSASIEQGKSAGDSGLSTFVGAEMNDSDRPDLGSASIVVSGGRGFGSEANFKLVYDLADKLGAAVGASRAAVDAGYIGNDYQVGQTGKSVAPDLYIALGISGAIQHLAGMSSSKVIVAINKDENAPIFEIADYGLVGDVFEVVPELMEKL